VCGVSERARETSVIRRKWPTRGCCTLGGGGGNVNLLKKEAAAAILIWG